MIDYGTKGLKNLIRWPTRTRGGHSYSSPRSSRRSGRDVKRGVDYLQRVTAGRVGRENQPLQSLHLRHDRIIKGHRQERKRYSHKWNPDGSIPSSLISGDIPAQQSGKETRSENNWPFPNENNSVNIARLTILSSMERE